MEKYHLIITSLAQSDIAECVRFVLRVSKDAAITLTNDIYRALNSLETFPERNSVFEMPKAFPFIVRKHIIKNRYIALYTVENNSVVIYRVIDSRRKFNYLLYK